MAATRQGDAGAGEAHFRRLGQVPALDGLRAVAVLLVILSHTPLLTGPELTPIIQINQLAKGGFLGVDVFFVLSGFLITALLLREQVDQGRVGFWAFYQRRGLRLIPALLLLLVVHAVYAEATGLPRDVEAKSAGAALFYVSNWLTINDISAVSDGLGHLWSLAIEEQFYLVWPAVMILFLGVQRRANVVVAVLVSAIVAIGIHRFFVWESASSWIPPFVRTDTRADSLLIGALLAVLWVRRLTPTRGLPAAAWVGTVAIGFTILAADPTQSFVYHGGFTLFAVLVAIVVLAAVDGRWSGGRVLSFGPLRQIGQVSYGLYLWHLAVFYAVARYTTSWPGALRVVLAFGLTVAFTAFSWRFVEQPALRLKHRLDRRAMPDGASLHDPTATT